jgi:uncharacterized protein YcbK (DUF882 family)
LDRDSWLSAAIIGVRYGIAAIGGMRRVWRQWFVRLALSLAIWLGGAASTVFAQQLGVAGADVSTSVDTPVVPGAAPEMRVISLRHHWTREQLEVTYKIGGIYQSEALARIDHFMRDWRCGRSIQMDPKLIDLLYDIRQDLGGQGAIRVVSAYRSEGYNASLLRAGRTVDPNSQHTLGHAADVYFPGIRGEVARQAAIKRGVGGVGYYPFSAPQFVHVDTGPVRQWIETDPSQRKATRVARLPRRRLQVDCSLTMTDVFENIPRDAAESALPEGAAVAVPEASGATANAATPSFLEGVSEMGTTVAKTQAAQTEAGGPPVVTPVLPASPMLAASPPRQKTTARPSRRVRKQAAATPRAQRKRTPRVAWRAHLS